MAKFANVVCERPLTRNFLKLKSRAAYSGTRMVAAFEFAVSRTKPFQTTPLNFYSSIDFMILRIDISNSRSKAKGLDF